MIVWILDISMTNWIMEICTAVGYCLQFIFVFMKRERRRILTGNDSIPSLPSNEAVPLEPLPGSSDFWPTPTMWFSTESTIILQKKHAIYPFLFKKKEQFTLLRLYCIYQPYSGIEIRFHYEKWVDTIQVDIEPTSIHMKRIWIREKITDHGTSLFVYIIMCSLGGETWTAPYPLYWRKSSHSLATSSHLKNMNWIEKSEEEQTSIQRDEPSFDDRRECYNHRISIWIIMLKSKGVSRQPISCYKTTLGTPLVTPAVNANSYMK